MKVAATAVVHSSEGAAAVLALHNESSVSLRDVPIQIDVKDAGGATVYRNNAAGTSATLVSAALVPARTTITWIDDQVPASGGVPASVVASVGEGTPTTGAIPGLRVDGAHLAEAGEAGRAGRQPLRCEPAGTGCLRSGVQGRNRDRRRPGRAAERGRRQLHALSALLRRRPLRRPDRLQRTGDERRLTRRNRAQRGS